MSTNGEVKPFILVTGGAGYVGCHTIIELLKAGYQTLVVDNLVNVQKGKNGAKPKSITLVEKISGKQIPFIEVNLQDKVALSEVFQKYDIQCVIHCAALKAVGESCEKPLEYYRNNVGGSVTLLEVMQEHNVKKFVFSSSATVYGDPVKLPVDEDHAAGNCTNPYGKTKYFIEEIAKDVCASDKNWRAVILRYFNPVGAHESGLVGENPLGTPNNLLPYIAQVAVGLRKQLTVFGNDYNTMDGTGLRDYIHIMDLAWGHVCAVKKIMEPSYSGWNSYNLGTGKGYTVLQVVEAFRKASGAKIPYQIVDRRAGDIAAAYADPTKAKKELGWSPTRDINEMCADAWRWQSKNPHGFADSDEIGNGHVKTGQMGNGHAANL